ncbi:hypothetical protein LSCM1_06372 [Leishmania martiniquensis]|uniref:Leucine-rich domain-containing protein n=1 Tax=Leishmania martiniquensis TaxID=1580590 RepID=A0A836HNQ6_9TRYP|nr:hypothetical protein LSCM1_06372 [Leishmania martiniquensis]
MGCRSSRVKSTKEGEGEKGNNSVPGSGASTDTSPRPQFEETIEIPASMSPGDRQQRGASEHSMNSAAKAERSASANRYATEGDLNPMCPVELRAIMDNMTDLSTGSSLSAPQLFRISPTERAEVEPGTWAWWREELRHERVTKDGYHRVLLQDVQTRLTTQHEDDPSTVELDFSSCYMEPTAPYVLGRLFASPQLKELRWITSLRLDGNYFTDTGFGTMLATMSAANEKQTILPVLRQLYLNNMNLDRYSVAGLFAYLFPVDRNATRSIPAAGVLRIAGSRVSRPSGAFITAKKHGPKVPLFPSMSVLSLSDNPGVGTAGLIVILRSFLAVHYEPHIFSVIDLSRCGIDRGASRYMREYFEQLSSAIDAGCCPVVPKRFVLMGNQHGIADAHEIYSPENTGIQLVL